MDQLFSKINTQYRIVKRNVPNAMCQVEWEGPASTLNVSVMHKGLFLFGSKRSFCLIPNTMDKVQVFHRQFIMLIFYIEPKKKNAFQKWLTSKAVKKFSDKHNSNCYTGKALISDEPVWPASGHLCETDLLRDMTISCTKSSKSKENLLSPTKCSFPAIQRLK